MATRKRNGMKRAYICVDCNFTDTCFLLKKKRLEKCPYSFWKGDVLFDTKEKAKEYFQDTLLSYQKIAITPADATGFTIGENL